MQVFKKKTINNDIYLINEMPLYIEYVPGNKNEAFFQKKKVTLGCINCNNPRCMYYNKKEISIDDIKDFAFDSCSKVCPVDAISITLEHKITIDSEKCIKCGLCMRRCPVGAIYSDYKQNILINDDVSNYDKVFSSDLNVQKQNELIDKFVCIPRKGILFNEDDKLLSNIYEKLFVLNNKTHDTLGRNLLIGLDSIAGKTRIGDVYSRMDVIYKSKDKAIGPVEIEFGKETLDASRAILDDVAVLNVRYGISKDKCKPLVICLQLPNARQGYWQVIKDIKNVEQIKIQTFSVGALMLLIWNNVSISLSNDCFYIDYDNKNLRICLEKIIKRKIKISSRLLGILEPIK